MTPCAKNKVSLQSPAAIKALNRKVFPMDKIMYRRGGALDWRALV